MKLTGFHLYHYCLPLTEPVVFRGTTMHHREGVLVRLMGDPGKEGWGEAAPLPGFSAEPLEEVIRQLLQLKESMVGQNMTSDWVDPDGAFVQTLDHTTLAPSGRFGFELAVWNLYAAFQGKPLPFILSATPRKTVSLSGLLMGSVEEICREASRMREAGYRVVKLKVGRRPVAEEIALTHRLYALLGPEVRLRLDANRAWDLEAALTFARAVAQCNLEYIEEPLCDPRQLPVLVGACPIPIALDETLIEIQSENLDEHAYACAVVLKPTLLGGLVATLRLARRATACGMVPVLSAAFETGIGMRALIALAASIDPDDIPAGLDPYRWLCEDLCVPNLVLQSRQLDVPMLLDTPYQVKRALLKRIDK